MMKWTSRALPIPGRPKSMVCHVDGCGAPATAWRSTDEGGEDGRGLGALLCERHKEQPLINAGFSPRRWVVVIEPEQGQLW